MAILKRRKRRSLAHSFREAVWPTMGWLRTFDYYRHRLFRRGDSTYKITAGLATGFAVSFSPFLGTHLLQAVFFGWLTRSSIIASLIGTLLGNPWTLPLMFWLAYKVGVAVCGLVGLGGFIAPPDGEALAAYSDAPLAFLAYLWHHPLKLLLPLALGGYICAFLSWPLAYGLMYRPVHMAHRTYRLQRLRRLRKRKSGNA